MARKVISADGHLDLFYLPPDTFTSRTSARLKDKVPQVVNIDGIPTWIGDGAVMGAYRGWMGRGGLTGHRGKRMMEAGWEPTHPSDPKLRLKDLDIDGVAAEVIYGIRFVEDSIKNPEVITATYRAYNDFIAEFCEYNPKRLVGVADIPAHSVEGAVDEIRKIGKGGLGLRGALFDWFNAPEPIWHPMWEPLWGAAEEADVALSFHIGAGHGTHHRRPARRRGEIVANHTQSLDDGAPGGGSHAGRRMPRFGDPLRRFGAPSETKSSSRRESHRLDSIPARSPRYQVQGRLVQRSHQDPAERAIPPADVGDFPGRQSRRASGGGLCAGQLLLGFGLSPLGLGLARFTEFHPRGNGESERNDAGQTHPRECHGAV